MFLLSIPRALGLKEELECSVAALMTSSERVSRRGSVIWKDHLFGVSTHLDMTLPIKQDTITFLNLKFLVPRTLVVLLYSLN